jgi:hypothetical protein
MLRFRRMDSRSSGRWKTRLAAEEVRSIIVARGE